MSQIIFLDIGTFLNVHGMCSTSFDTFWSKNVISTKILIFAYHRNCIA